MRIFRWAALCLVGLACQRGADAAEPHAVFVLNREGWVEFALHQDGRPVANAVIEIIDERGQTFAKGDSGDTGEATFPIPRGASFLVEIKTGARTADPIRLFKIDNTVEPARVLLSYGLRPCCRFKDRSESATVETPPAEPPAAVPTALPEWLWLGAALAGLAGAAAMVFVLRR